MSCRTCGSFRVVWSALAARYRCMDCDSIDCRPLAGTTAQQNPSNGGAS